jgi:hypothetical protein
LVFQLLYLLYEYFNQFIILLFFFFCFFKAVRVGTYLWQFSVYCETDEETEKDRLPKEERITIPGIETKSSGALRSNEQTRDEHLSSAAHPRNGNRSDYDNVTSIQAQQHRTGSNVVKTGGGKRTSPGRGYEEANV